MGSRGVCAQRVEEEEESRAVNAQSSLERSTSYREAAAIWSELKARYGY